MESNITYVWKIAKVFRPMDVDMSYRCTIIRETADDVDEKDIISNSFSKRDEPPIVEEYEEINLR